MSNKITVLVDLDDTVENLADAWCKWLNKEYGTAVSAEDLTGWDVERFFPSLTTEQVRGPLHTDEFWHTVSPKIDAMEYIHRLYDEGYEIYFCTATDYRSVRVKYESIIKRFFPDINWRHVVITHNKQLLRADYLVDDAPHNLVGGEYDKVLMSAPHNKGFDAETAGMHRVSTWKEVYDYIHERSPLCSTIT